MSQKTDRARTLNPVNYRFGVITDDDKAVLVDSLRVTSVNLGNKKGTIVEVGTLRGKTTKGILNVVLDLGWNISLVTIDKDPRCRVSWMRLCGGLELESFFVAGTNPDALRDVDEILWAFVDGCHCEECVAKDIRAIAPKIPVGGQICFHDAGPQVEVGMLVHERYHGDGKKRLYGVTTAIEKSSEMEGFVLVDESSPNIRPSGAPTPYFGGVQCFERMK